MFRAFWIYLISLLVICNFFSQEFLYNSSTESNSKIIKSEQVIGFEIGKRPIRHHEAIQYLKQLAQNSPRVLFFEAGKTYENRLLCYEVISSEKNIQNIEKVKSDLTQYADPRINFSGNLDELPGLAWMMYSIHGDELSGTDAGIRLAYQLAAGTDEKTTKILNELIVGIDPMENPDGRERFLAQMQQWGTDIINSDVQLAGGVAHDFNNMLTVIHGYSEMLLYRDLHPEFRNLIQEILNASTKATRLTSQLLAFSRKQIIQPKILNLNQVITDQIKMLHRLLGEDVEVSTAFDPQLRLVKADIGQIEQIIKNISINARDAMPLGGKLIVETKNVEFDDEDRQQHPEIKPDLYTMLSITDTGIGMDEITRTRVFKPF